VARAAGFERPILHGMCSYGIAGWALVEALCGGDASRLTRLDLRFAHPVFPGETLVTEIWLTGPGCAALRVRAPARAEAKRQVVLDHGVAEFEPST
jgi:acyl dehydratase